MQTSHDHQVTPRRKKTTLTGGKPHFAFRGTTIGLSSVPVRSALYESRDAEPCCRMARRGGAAGRISFARLGSCVRRRRRRSRVHSSRCQRGGQAAHFAARGRRCAGMRAS